MNLQQKIMLSNCLKIDGNILNEEGILKIDLIILIYN